MRTAWFVAGLLLLAGLAAASVSPTFGVTGPYRVPSSDPDIYYGQSIVSVMGAMRLQGNAAFAIAPFSGQHIHGTNTNSTIHLPLIIPHINETDDRYGCTPLQFTQNEQQQSYSGSLMLVERKGGCDFHTKVATAQAAGFSGVVLYNCDPPSCPELGLLTVISYQDEQIPTFFFAHDDGQLWRTYLLQRRNWFLAGQPIVNISSSNDVSLPVTFGVKGTGALVDSEFVALRTIAAEMTLDADSVSFNSALRSWADLLDSSKSNLDPCLDRLVGIWCEDGHIVSIYMEGLGQTGTIHSAYSQFTHLAYLDLSLPGMPGAGLRGSLPDTLCALPVLRAISMQGNALTTVPMCLGNSSGLIVIDVSSNQITNMPAGFAEANPTNLQYFDISANRLDGFHSSLLAASALRYLSLQLNPAMRLQTLDLAGRALSQAWPNLTTLYLRDVGMSGVLPTNIFDHANTLRLVDLSRQQLSPGPLPNFIGCAALTVIVLSENQFGLSIPVSWGALPSLHTVRLNANQLVWPVDALSTSSSVQVLDLSYNNISLSSDFIMANGDDLGVFFHSIIPPSLVELHIDYNQLEGIWSGGWILSNNWRTLTMAHNYLRALPYDLFANTSPLITIDVSFNRLDSTIAGLPADTPRAVAAIEVHAGLDPVVSFDLRGNPSFIVSPLPNWIRVSDEMAPFGARPMICPVLAALSTELLLQVDPTFTAYSGCACSSGTFGVAPYCATVPTLTRVTIADLPLSLQPSSLVANFSVLLAGLPLMDGDISLASDGNTILYGTHPPSFQDWWYGGSRSYTQQQLAVQTTWMVDLQSVRRLTLNDGTTRMIARAPAVPASTISASAAAQPVRSILLDLILSRSQVDIDFSLIIYDFRRSLIATIGMEDILAAPNLNNSDVAMYTTNGYNVSMIDAPVRIQVRSPGNAVYIAMSATQSPTARLIGVYRYEFKCTASHRLVQVTDGYQCLINSTIPQYLPGLNYTYECLALEDPLSPATPLQQLASPIEVDYAGCRCSRGQWGRPPYCAPIPSQVDISPFTLPSSDSDNQVNGWNVRPAQFAFMAQLTDDLNSTHPTDVTIESVPPGLLNEYPSIQAGALHSPMPLPMSDEWFGSQRYVAGMECTFVVDLLDVRQQRREQASSGQPNSSVPIFFNADRVASTSIGASADLQPVRVLTLHLIVDRAAFTMPGTTLRLWETDVAENVLLLELTPTAAAGSSSPPSSNSASTDPFACDTSIGPGSEIDLWRSSGFDPLISGFLDPCYLSTNAYSNSAIVQFSSRDASRQHFLSSYTFAFECPENMPLDDGNKCSPPRSSDSRVTLLAVLLPLLAVLLLLFAWVVRERSNRQRFKQAQDRMHRELAADGSGELERLTKQQKKMESEMKREPIRLLWRGIVVHILSLVLDTAFLLMNWVSVGMELHRVGAVDFGGDGMEVAYLTLLVVGTFAMVTNSASRIITLQGMRTDMVREAAIAATAKANHPEHEPDVAEGSEALEASLLHVQRDLTSAKISALSLVLDTIPIGIFNVVKLYVGGSASLQYHSLLLGLLLIGFKSARALLMFDLRAKRLRIRYELVVMQSNVRRESMMIVEDGGGPKESVSKTPSGPSIVPQELLYPHSNSGRRISAVELQQVTTDT